MAFLFVESSSAYSNISVVQSAVKALKLLFFSAGLISTLLMVKGALIPFVYENLFHNLIACWNLFRYFMSCPLYICIIINSFVVLIAVTSTFQNHEDDPVQSTGDDERSSVFRGRESIDDSESVGEKGQEECVGRDEERESDDTIESTWKTIVEGKTKMLSKSESVPPRSRKWKELRKLETFNDGASIRRLGGLRRERDPSVGVHEFNQQVEAFINKFNQDMRLQRQESHQRFLDMLKPA